MRKEVAMANPVFVNELRQNLFRRKPLLGFALWALATIFLVWLAQFTQLSRYPLSWLPVFALPLIVPPFAAGTFAKEYEQQTWQDLYLTRLTNVQVVVGKFGAALLQVTLVVLSFLPAIALMQIYEAAGNPYFGTNQSGYYQNGYYIQNGYSNPAWTFAPGGWILVMGAKLLLSASLYVLLGMTCSRYSRNRRTALVWSYVALFLYALLGTLVWMTVGVEMARDDIQLNANNGITYNPSPTDPLAPGFMQGIHLIFCSVIGIGTFVLLWVSMSEQRGYKSDGRTESNRAWQPVGRPRSME